MSNIQSFENRAKTFTWEQAERELDYAKGDVINIGWYCSDRICDLGMAEKTALICENSDGDEQRFSYDDLRLSSNAFGQLLRSLGIGPGERVCLFMDRIPELYFAFLGILKTGAVAQPLFSAFGDESLFVRLENAQTAAIITQRRHVPKVRKIIGRMPWVRQVIVVDGDPASAAGDREISFDPAASEKPDQFDIHPTRAESPSVLHYTSGTTGQPKGVVHVHYALISQYITAKWSLDLRNDDIYWCTADPGWVTGTSYGIIGAFSNGVTQCILDAGFSADLWYRFIEKHHVSVWYTAPTAIRSLMKAGEAVVAKYNLASLRHLASVGEPLNAGAVAWSEKMFGKPFHDTYWQTETGSIMISNFPGMKIKPGSMGKPFPATTATIVNPATFEPLAVHDEIGLIAIRPGWPAMMRGYWNNEETYRSKFANGWYLPGDRALVDADGYFWFVGRDDDVINTGGHLVSPFEVESALLTHPAVAESAVVAKPDFVNMEVVKAFVALKPGFEPGDELILEIMNFVRKKLSPIAMPQEIEFVASLPKTRSGKIMRRILRAKEWGGEAGDTSTLEED